ncbi:hypothetical protein QI30_00970 [Kurthia sp. 3B1D]|uniref:Uncharacterized protein n=1 Tax=Candidatus Kurthia intestinigallinarum TaxID=1562256 RepID=A0A433RYF3_9BACL|nr:hypothetical protein QI30_00970 [Kurthia sp. 3B1D]
MEENWKLGSEDQLVRVNGIFGMISSSMMPIEILVFAFNRSFIQADHPLKKESEATKQFDIG